VCGRRFDRLQAGGVLGGPPGSVPETALRARTVTRSAARTLSFQPVEVRQIRATALAGNVLSMPSILQAPPRP
jgi:hypothetical protein